MIAASALKLLMASQNALQAASILLRISSKSPVGVCHPQHPVRGCPSLRVYQRACLPFHIARNHYRLPHQLKVYGVPKYLPAFCHWQHTGHITLP